MRRLIISTVLVLFASPSVVRADVTKEYETVKVARGIYAFIAPEPRTGLVNGNSTVIIGDEGVVVVDSGQFPSLASQQIAQIREWTDQPVRYLVNTHWHWDHNLGNAVYREAFPGVSIVSTPFTRESIQQYTTTFLTGFTGGAEQMIEALEGQLESGKKRDGTELRPQEIDYGENLVHDLRSALPELRLAAVDLPDLTFESELTIHLGNREVRLIATGPANTAGDVVVYVPDEKVLVTGDLVVYPTPYATSAYPAQWIRALRSLTAREIAAIVPGHGPVQRDLDYVELLMRSLQFVVDEARAAIAEGLTLEEARKRLDLSSLREAFAGENSVRQKAFDDYFAASVVESAWHEAKGEPIDESPF